MVRLCYPTYQSQEKSDLVLMVGHLDWGGQGFSKTARNISLFAEGHRSPILHLELPDPSGDYSLSEIDLATHIANIDGELVYIDEEE